MPKEICRLLKIKYPIVQGGMGNISNAQLTAAVSEAGGLGTIGCGTMTAEEVESIIVETKTKTNKPFAVNIPINVTSYGDKLIDIIIKQKIPIVSLSAGNPEKYMSKLKENGIKVIAIVATVKHAKKAEETGADALVAEGFEAAGINSSWELTTLTLIPQIVKNVNIPVIAAGGIGNGHGLAAALMLGAQGVQMGTRFVATEDSPFHSKYKQAILQATDTTTKVIGRSIGQSRRVLASEYINIIKEKEKAGITPENFKALTTEDKHIKGALEGDLATGFINGGQVSGLIDSLPTVKEVIETMMKEAKLQIENISNELHEFKC